jgi:adenylate kinase
MKLVILGPPGSGKGTYGGEISKKRDIPHIEAGRMLREEVAKGSKIGKEAEAIMKAGKLVPDKVIIDLIAKRLKEKDAKKGFLLDGFPRTIAQAEALEKVTKLDLVMNLVVPTEILMEKMLARRTCPKCGAIYNIANINKTIAGKKYVLPPLLPKKEGICDKCGTKLTQRDDETPEIIKNRFSIYENQTSPLIDFYDKEALLKNVFVTAGKEIMLEKIFEMMEEEMAENE